MAHLKRWSLSKSQKISARAALRIRLDGRAFVSSAAPAALPCLQSKGACLPLLSAASFGKAPQLDCMVEKMRCSWLLGLKTPNQRFIQLGSLRTCCNKILKHLANRLPPFVTISVVAYLMHAEGVHACGNAWLPISSDVSAQSPSRGIVVHACHRALPACCLPMRVAFPFKGTLQLDGKRKAMRMGSSAAGMLGLL